MKDRKINGLICDWAGTTVDFGCFAPLDVFCTIFEESGVPVSQAEAREPMGMLKWDHIKAMLEQPRIKEAWTAQKGEAPSDKTVDALYAEFEPALMKSLHNYCTPISGVLETIQSLRESGLKIGSTTGYTRAMIDVVAAGAKELGYAPDTIVTADECRAGRPAPWMIYHNCEALDLQDLAEIVKAGDTLSDVKEGVNASVWSIGIAVGSSEMGYTESEYEALTAEEQAEAIARCTKRFKEAGAHFVIETFSQLPTTIETINKLLAEGQTPLTYKG